MRPGIRYDLLEVLDAYVRPTLTKNAFGSVPGGWLRVKGTLESRCFSESEMDESNYRRETYWDEAQVGGEEQLPEIDDDARGRLEIASRDSLHPSRQREREQLLAQESADNHRTRKSTILPIGWATDTANNHTDLAALILQPVGDTRINEKGILESLTSVYRRVGFTQYPFWSLEHFKETCKTGYEESLLDKLQGNLKKRWMNIDPREMTTI